MMLELARIRQTFARPRVTDLTGAVTEALNELDLRGRLRPGSKVAITAGSRGIANIGAILAAVVHQVRNAGGEPFLVAAMGSHGGGTVAGQTEVLRHLGITEKAVGAPLRVTDQVAEIGRTAGGTSVYCDAEAARADALLVVNRVKPHTSFRHRVASGILKMMAVGMGKVPGATQVHKLGAPHIGPAIEDIAQVFRERTPLLGGLAILENGYEETARIAGLRPENLLDGETLLLQEAETLLPRLPVHDLHVLVIQEMGKNFSGTGIDTNVIGRWRLPGLSEPPAPRVRHIVVLGLSDASGGNANGIGLADFVTRRLVNAIDFRSTYLNALTAGFPFRAAIPITLESDREAIETAVQSLALDPGEALRLVVVPNTLHLEQLWVSPPVLGELAGRDGIEVVQATRPLAFAAGGRLLQPFH